ncbi:hemolysin family protein [bacterium]|nr:hemolysin family protein [bacterium]
MINPEILLIILFLVLSAYFSGTETVFLTVNRIRLEGFLHRNRRGAKSAAWFLNRPSRFILTTLVGTNLANIALTTVLTAYLLERGVPAGWILPIDALLILIFGEILPKSLGRDLADPASLWIAPILRVFRFFLFPLNRSARFITSLVLKMFGVDSEEVQRFFTKRDLEVLIQESAATGMIPSHRESTITRILHFRSLCARDVMTPRTEIVALHKSDTIEDLRKNALSTGYSKFPVYEEDIDHIVGVVYTRDIFDKPETLEKIVRPIQFFPDQKKAWTILKELRRLRQSSAMIVDEWGGTAGLVTMEDLLEELTGEIEDEYDPARLQVQELGENRWMVSARMEVDELIETYSIPIPQGEYETIGGYLNFELGRILKAGEKFTLGEFHFEIAKATKTRIRVIILEKIESGKDT